MTSEKERAAIDQMLRAAEREKPDQPPSLNYDPRRFHDDPIKIAVLVVVSMITGAGLFWAVSSIIAQVGPW